MGMIGGVQFATIDLCSERDDLGPSDGLLCGFDDPETGDSIVD